MILVAHGGRRFGLEQGALEEFAETLPLAVARPIGGARGGFALGSRESGTGGVTEVDVGVASLASLEVLFREVEVLEGEIEALSSSEEAQEDGGEQEITHSGARVGGEMSMQDQTGNSWGRWPRV